MADVRERVLAAVDALAEEVVDFTSELVRLPTVNPPGEGYEECARVIGDRLGRGGFAVEYLPAEGRPEHTRAHPRVNVVGTRPGKGKGPLVHLNGHFDVVPAGDGWTVDPFGGHVRDGKIWGRGTGDMKAGLAAAVYAVEALRRADVQTAGALEVSGTVDEESGGFAGVAFLAETGRIARGRTDYVIIPEPLGVDRICVGHRGVWWFEVELHGRTAHGSMPFLGVSAIDHMAALLEAVRVELQPALTTRRTAMPVVPEGAGRATLNVNAVVGGQSADGIQTPCVADRCRAIFDRRFLVEEGLDGARSEIAALLEGVAARVPGFRYAVRDLMIVSVDPSRASDSELAEGERERRASPLGARDLLLETVVEVAVVVDAGEGIGVGRALQALVQLGDVDGRRDLRRHGLEQREIALPVHADGGMRHDERPDGPSR